MTTEFEKGAASRVLRLRALDGGWTPIHVTAHRVELDEGTFAGLLSLRLPTDDEVAAAEPPKTRKSRARKDKAAQS
jgi:hypothetical protein